MAVKTRVVEVAELSSILTLAIRNNETGQLKEEVDRAALGCHSRFASCDC